MGRKGWAGKPPSDDAEARKRIVDAGIRCVERRGPAQTTLTDIADDLGVTRRTIYRYFDSIEDLFTAIGNVALGSFVTRFDTVTADIEDIGERLIEIVAYIIEMLPSEPLLTLLLAHDRISLFSRQMLLPAEIARNRTILEHLGIDWAANGYDERALDELVEFLLRIIQSMTIAPSTPPRSGAELRAYLRRWIGPALSQDPLSQDPLSPDL